MKSLAQYLLIDTTRTDCLVGIANHQGVVDQLAWRQSPNQFQDTLQYLNQLLRRQRLSLRQIKAIFVRTGPGSFTGSRVGVAIANALAWSMNIRVIGYQDIGLSQSVLDRLKNQRSRRFAAARPHYDSPPKITKPSII